MTVATRARMGGFTPAKFGGLAVWLDAGEITGLADGDPVATWPDVSGQGRDATQAVAGNRPTYKTAILAGQPVVRFDGTSDYLATAAFGPLAQPNTVTVVAKLATATGLQFLIDGFTEHQRHAIFSTGADWSIYAGIVVPAGGTPDTAAHVLTFVADTPASVLRVDGTELLAVDAGVQNLGGLTLGATADFFTEFLNGDLAEVVVYDSALGAPSQLERYLGAKYGITVA